VIDNIHQKVSEMIAIAHHFMRTDHIDLNDLSTIIQLMQIMRDHLQYIINTLAKQTKKSNSSTPKIIKKNTRTVLDTEAIEYLTNKIKKSYNHNDIKKAMLELIDNTISNFTLVIDEIDAATKRFYSYGQDISSSGNKLVRD